MLTRTLDDASLPQPGPRPFWHAGAALIGPQQLQPTPYVNSSFSMIEGTPLYVGIPYVKNITYRNKEHPSNQQTFTVGGMVEPFAAGTAGPPPGAESVQAASGAEYTTVLQPEISATVAVIAAASSEFYGPAIASILPKLSHAMDINYTYWSPQQPAAQASPSMLLGDGGCYENQLVIAMIQRRVQNIVVFASSDAPLAPKEKWPVKPPFTPVCTHVVRLERERERAGGREGEGLLLRRRCWGCPSYRILKHPIGVVLPLLPM